VKVKSAQRDDDGYLVNPADWSRELAIALAREETLLLTEEHWVVRNGPRNLDSAVSEIFLGFQAANSGVTCS